MRRTTRRGLGLGYSALLAAFTAFVLLDAFVIPRRYAEVTPSADPAPVQSAVPAEPAVPGGSAAPGATDATTPSPPPTGPAGAEPSPVTPAAPSVTVTTERLYDTDIHIADIVLTSPDQLKTAFAEDTYGRNVKAATSEIAADHGALVAVNGDFYGSRTSGYVIRGGVLYRDRSAGADQEDLVVAADGTFRLVTEGDVSAADLLAEGAVHVFSFGPGLVDQGQVVVGPEDEVDKAMASNPRTALAQVGPLHYLFVVADGRTDANAGLSLAQLADVLVQLGAQTAYNLDGGGSSTLYYDGAVVNTPTTSGRHSGEREVSDIVYVTP